MNGGDIMRIRCSLKMSRYEFGRALGFEGNSQTEQRRFKRIETGRLPVTDDLVRRVLNMQRRHVRRLHKLREGL